MAIVMIPAATEGICDCPAASFHIEIDIHTESVPFDDRGVVFIDYAAIKADLSGRSIWLNVLPLSAKQPPFSIPEHDKPLLRQDVFCFQTAVKIALTVLFRHGIRVGSNCFNGSLVHAPSYRLTEP